MRRVLDKIASAVQQHVTEIKCTYPQSVCLILYGVAGAGKRDRVSQDDRIHLSLKVSTFNTEFNSNRKGRFSPRDLLA